MHQWAQKSVHEKRAQWSAHWIIALQGASLRGRQLYFNFQVLQTLFSRRQTSKAPFLTLRVATPSRAPGQAPLVDWKWEHQNWVQQSGASGIRNQEISSATLVQTVNPRREEESIRNAENICKQPVNGDRSEPAGSWVFFCTVHQVTESPNHRVGADLEHVGGVWMEMRFQLRGWGQLGCSALELAHGLQSVSPQSCSRLSIYFAIWWRWFDDCWEVNTQMARFARMFPNRTPFFANCVSGRIAGLRRFARIARTLWKQEFFFLRIDSLWENWMGGFRKGGFQITDWTSPQTRRRNSKRSIDFK